MADKKVNLKVTEETRRLLRIIAALTGEQIMDVVHRIAAAELERARRLESSANTGEEQGT